MDIARNPDTPDDLSALAWVQDELRRSLEAAHKSLRRHLREFESTRGSDVDRVDPSVLRSARQQLHQGVGALELVGLPAAANVLRASEAAVLRFATKGLDIDLVSIETIEHASFALLDYLARRLAGKPVAALAMFPQYRAVQALAGADRIHPADLWSFDWRWQEMPLETGGVAPRTADAAVRGELEALLLVLMRGDATLAATQMSDLFAGLAAGATTMPSRVLWQLAAAFFEAQARGLLRADVYSKRIGSRLLAQLRIGERGGGEISERLAQDLLFFCAQAASPGAGRQSPRLSAVRRQYGLASVQPVDYEQIRLGRFDPAVINQARKRVAAAKDAWAGIAGGEMHRLPGLIEQFTLVGESLVRLVPSGEVLAQALHDAVSQTVQSESIPPPSLAMEVATAVLWVEASLEDGEFDHPELDARVKRLAQRIDGARSGSGGGALEPWMEELYRHVSDRQTMGSVVQELRSALSDAEKLIDQFFRKPDDRNVLIPVPSQLATMRGVLSVLGMEQASHAVLRMRDEIDALIKDPGFEPARANTSGRFERLAGNLGALGFLIDMLSVQPQLAKSLFVYDERKGTLSPVMGRQPPRSGMGALDETASVAAAEPRLIEQALSLAVSAASDDVPLERITLELDRISHEATVADQPALAATMASAKQALAGAIDANDVDAARDQLAEALTDFVATASGPVGIAETAAPSAPAAAPAATTGLEHDDEMRDVFLEEAYEVIGGAHDALAALTTDPEAIEHLTTVRRAFHTLKGSSRMVGLREFGEAAWSCEQLFNARLAEAPRSDERLAHFTGQALAYLNDWVESIASGREARHSAAAVKAAADGLRLDDRLAELPLPGAAAPAIAAALPQPEVIAEPAPQTAQSVPAPVEAVAPSFELDLRGLGAETPLARAAPAPVALPPPAPASTPEVEYESLAEQSDAEVTLPLPVLDQELMSARAQAPSVPAEKLALDIELPEAPASAPAEPATVSAAAQEQIAIESDQIKMIGPLRISIPLFNIYLSEADELSRRLTTEVAEWAMELNRPVGETATAMAHSLAGSSATIGFQELSQLARQLEHCLMRSDAIGSGSTDEGRLFVDAADEIRRLLHQFAAGFLKAPSRELLDRLHAHELDATHRLEASAATAEPAPTQWPPFVPPAVPAPAVHVVQAVASEAEVPEALTQFGAVPLKSLDELPIAQPVRAASTVDAAVPGGADDIDAVDAVDAELFPIFEEECHELLPQLATRMREWQHRPSDDAGASGCMRTLHTLKGGARLAGAMRLGEMAHRLETAIERLVARGNVNESDIDALMGRVDVLAATFEALRARDAAAYATATAAVEAASPVVPVATDSALVEPVAEAPESHRLVADVEPPVELPIAVTPVAPMVPPPAPRIAPADVSVPEPAAAAQPARAIDWTRFATAEHGQGAVSTAADRRSAQRIGGVGTGVVRVRATLLDRLVNQAGEVSITRSRLESEVAQMRGSLGDLVDNLERLRHQLRDIELQAETQISSRMEAARAASQAFDPLEMDRFTRFQELTRMMAESVNDVATVQRALTKALQAAEDGLAAQSRLTRDLQDDLLRTRMVEFDGLSDRLYRVVRQAAKETGKQVRLDIVGGSAEIDRGVLERMTPAFEHLLRNCVTHGIELPDTRLALGKDATGSVVVALSHEGNEVAIEFRDDGAGLDLARIRARGIAMGLIAPDANPTEAELANLIYVSGFSTAEAVSELAGRGVGMDVVRAEVVAIGGRIETATTAGRGTSFKLVVPLTTAVTQVVMLRCGSMTVAVPSTLVEIVRRAKPVEIEQAYASGVYLAGDRPLPFFWLGGLLQASPRGLELGRSVPIVVIRSAQQRVALHVDEVLGNQEVVVKNLGPQLSRLPGLVGMTLLASGAVTLIYNPVALATLYGDAARVAARDALQAPSHPELQRETIAALAPLVMVVDDSLTVRRITQRLLAREGYRVVVAKDGLEALEKLADERPAVLLSDIEMPRMDGFDLVRNVRSDQRLADLPVIMITSRIAQKHRDLAAELGVDHYLGKPYAEEDLLALVARYTAVPVAH